MYEFTQREKTQGGLGVGSEKGETESKSVQTILAVYVLVSTVLLLLIVSRANQTAGTPRLDHGTIKFAFHDRRSKRASKRMKRASVVATRKIPRQNKLNAFKLKRTETFVFIEYIVQRCTRSV